MEMMVRIVTGEKRVSEFEIKIVKYLGNVPVITYEAKEPAELYNIPPYFTDNYKRRARIE